VPDLCFLKETGFADFDVVGVRSFFIKKSLLNLSAATNNGGN
jgi:hypothetical protein